MPKFGINLLLWTDDPTDEQHYPLYERLAGMAISWVLRQRAVTGALIGASRPEQIADCVGALSGPQFGKADLDAIETHLFSTQ